jgi:glutathione S-transferase
MDSNLIIDYAECLAGRALLPDAPGERGRVLAQVGLALAACEKTMQMVYEHKLRPPEKQHQPWLDRVQSQLLAACSLLERACGVPPAGERIDQGGVSTAVAWGFMQLMLPQTVLASQHPRLAAWSAWAETLPAFRRYPIA